VVPVPEESSDTLEETHPLNVEVFNDLLRRSDLALARMRDLEMHDPVILPNFSAEDTVNSKGSNFIPNLAFYTGYEDREVGLHGQIARRPVPITMGELEGIRTGKIRPMSLRTGSHIFKPALWRAVEAERSIGNNSILEMIEAVSHY
jgi:hypothetical protein